MEDVGCAPFDDVGDGARKHQQAFGHLQGYHSCAMFSDVVDGLVDLKRVIRRQLFDGIVQLRVGEDVVRYLVCYDGLHAWF